VQGSGSALIAPSALTLLLRLYRADPRGLARGFVVYGAAAPAGSTTGVFLGGVFTEYASWPWVHFINVPIGVGMLVLTARALPADASVATGRVDVPGALAVTAGLTTAVYAVVQAPEVGWDAAETRALLAVAVLALTAFVVMQAHGRTPLVRLSIVRVPGLAAGNAVQALLGAAWMPMWFFLNLYLQRVLGYSPFASGAALLPVNAVILLGMLVVAPRVVARTGARGAGTLGLTALAAALVWLSSMDAEASYGSSVLPASILAAFGMSLSFIPTMQAAMASAPAEDSGTASGLVNTSYAVGSALGLAVVAAIAAAHGAGRLKDPAALVNGYSAAFLAAAAVAGAAALACGTTLRSVRAVDEAPTQGFGKSRRRA
jgi:hypothetical protein